MDSDADRAWGKSCNQNDKIGDWRLEDGPLN